MPGGKKSAGRRPRRKQRPEGERSRAAWPIKTFSVKKPRPKGEEKHFKKRPGPQAQKNSTLNVPEGCDRLFGARV